MADAREVIARLFCGENEGWETWLEQADAILAALSDAGLAVVPVEQAERLTLSEAKALLRLPEVVHALVHEDFRLIGSEESVKHFAAAMVAAGWETVDAA